ncbi:hypothetical protein Hanom_Chr08g00734971 [Helianthus anomalus]
MMRRFHHQSPYHMFPFKPLYPHHFHLKIPFSTHPLVHYYQIEYFFKIGDPLKRTFPSLYSFKQPQHLDEYLKMKARQAEVIAREDSKGLGERKYQGLLSHELNKIRKLEVFAKDLSKSMSEKPIDTELEKELRVDYIDHIMKHMPYKVTRSQFKDWSSDALLE